MPEHKDGLFFLVDFSPLSYAAFKPFKELWFNVERRNILVYRKKARLKPLIVNLSEKTMGNLAET